VWNPHSSNILQLATSLQGLILGSSEPYFLEASYVFLFHYNCCSHEKLKGTPVGAKNSIVYNESAVLLSLEAITVVLAVPLQDFETLLRKYYLEHGDAIIANCEAYLKEDKSESEDLFLKEPSLGFKKALAKLIPKVKSALEDNKAVLEKESQ
jgi:hypothetical protein